MKERFVRADRSGRFRWEPIVAQPEPLADDSSDDFIPDQFGPVAPPAVPVAVHLPPVSMPVTIGVGTGQRQVLTVPTREMELEYIRQHATISNVPHGNRLLHRRNGSILKASPDTEWLYRYMLQNIPDWRNTLSV